MFVESDFESVFVSAEESVSPRAFDIVLFAPDCTPALTPAFRPNVAIDVAASDSV